MQGIYSATVIARYLVRASRRRALPIDGLKLQQLLYFSQMLFIERLGRPCFREKMRAGKAGPYIPKVREMFAEFDDWFISAKNIREPRLIRERHKALLREVIKTYEPYSGEMLVPVTKRQSPWRKAAAKGPNTVIKNRDIQQFLEKEKRDEKKELFRM